MIGKCLEFFDDCLPAAVTLQSSRERPQLDRDQTHQWIPSMPAKQPAGRLDGHTPFSILMSRAAIHLCSFGSRTCVSGVKRPALIQLASSSGPHT